MGEADSNYSLRKRLHERLVPLRRALDYAIQEHFEGISQEEEITRIILIKEARG